MPQHEHRHQPGHQIPPELKEMLLRCFAEADLKRLERLGGRVLISITSPYNENRRKGTQVQVVDEKYVKQLQQLKDSPDQLKAVLGQLDVKQLRQVAALLGQPLRSKANAAEIKAELVGCLQAEDFWRRISGSSVEL